jgi:hypothetical protein
MWTMSENEMSCAEFADAAAELALGVLTGRERARALAHLDRCEACRENVRQLTVTGEELVGLLPAIEPPAGFETRVMERLGLGTPAPAPVTTPAPVPVRPLSPVRRFGRKLADWTGGETGRSGAGTGRSGGGTGRSGGGTGWSGVRQPRRILVAAAMAVAVIAAGLGGWGLHGGTSSPTTSALSSATLLTASQQSAGTIYFYDAGSRWLYMSVNLGSGDNSTVICQVEGPDGHVTTVGSFRLTGGYGYWGSPDPVTDGQLTGARLVTTTGKVLATATFAA